MAQTCCAVLRHSPCWRAPWVTVVPLLQGLLQQLDEQKKAADGERATLLKRFDDEKATVLKAKDEECAGGCGCRPGRKQSVSGSNVQALLETHFYGPEINFRLAGWAPDLL